MRKYFILLILSIFLGFVTYYLLLTLNPFDPTKIAELATTEHITAPEELKQVEIELVQRGLILEYLDLKHVAAIMFTLSLAIVTGFALLHLAIEKVLFRKFYQHPSVVTAARRGIFLALGVDATILYRLYAAEVYLIVVTWILLLVLEVIITKVVAKPHVEEPTSPEEKEVPADSEIVV